MRKCHFFVLLAVITAIACRNTISPLNEKRSYKDETFLQDYSVKYYSEDPSAELLTVNCDRNGFIQILSTQGLMKPSKGEFLIPGEIKKDYHYKPVADKKILLMNIYDRQLIYADDSALFSNGWAGGLFITHGITGVRAFAGGKNHTFLLAGENELVLLDRSGIIWKGFASLSSISEIKYDRETNSFYILGREGISVFSPQNKESKIFLSLTGITSFDLIGERLVAGTSYGYLEYDKRSRKQIGTLNDKMPCNNLTVVSNIRDNLWFGSINGAMRLRDDGRFDYYASERWLPSDSVAEISEGPENSVLVLTRSGMAKICFIDLTLELKAEIFEKQVRERHIRHGFNATLSGMHKGDPWSGSLSDSDNDGLWTSMYLAAEAFRYNVTRSEDALLNVKESLDAMERLYSITQIPGFPARSFERRGYKFWDQPWRRASDPEWDWKSTTSSDEAIGHIFSFGVIAEVVDDEETRSRAIMLIDTLMAHILRNNLYLVDWNGEPTRWGRWNPDYVNGFPEMVGDRKLNSSNIISMLQTAFHFTGKEKYRNTAFELLINHGYFENLMRPMKNITMAPQTSSELSRMLSESWNHSDDEMYFLGYWGLLRYAFNDTLKMNYREAVIDHWNLERTEKDALWNIIASLAVEGDFDLEEAVWYLKEYPLDLIEWSMINSHRSDIEKVESNFRDQTIYEVLPPDELWISRHNTNRFVLDGGAGGTSEMSSGDIWLLPYWMGRWMEVISAPDTD